MAQPISIPLQDGRSYTISDPEEIAKFNAYTPAQQESVRQQIIEQYSARPAEVAPDVGQAEDIGRAVLAGGIRGVAGVPGMGGDIELLGEAVGRYFGYEPTPGTLLPTTEQVLGVLPGGVQRAAAYEPATAPGRIAKIAAEFAAPTSPASKAQMAFQTTAGLLAGGVTEAAGEGAGAVAGLAPTAVQLLARRRTPAERIAADILPTPEQVEAGKEMQRLAGEMGAKLLPGEAIPSPQMRAATQEIMAAPEAFDIVTEAVGERAPTMLQAAREQAGLLGPQTNVPLALSREVGDAAQKVYEMAANKRTNASKAAGYGRIAQATVPSDDIAALIKRIEQKAKEQPTGSPIAKQLMQLSASLKTKKTKTVVNPKTGKPRKVTKIVPQDNLGALEGARIDFQERMSLPDFSEKAISKRARGVVGPFISELDEILIENPDLAAGREAYKNITQQVIEPLEDTGLAALRKKNMKPDAIVRSILDPNKSSPETINKIGDEVSKVNKDAFPKLARFYLESAIDATLASTDELPSFNKLAQRLRKTDKAAANLNAFIGQAAKAQGKDPKAVTEGFNRLLDVFEVAIDLPGAPTRDYVKKAGRINFLSRIADFEFLAPQRGIIRGAEDLRRPGQIRALANALVDDDALSALEKMAKTDPRKRAFQDAFSSVMAVARLGRIQDDSNQGLLSSPDYMTVSP